jgi:thioredoxin 1
VTGNSAVEFYKIDVDDQTAISQEVGIRAVCCSLLVLFGRRSTVLTVSQLPTFIVYKDGGKKGELIGADRHKLEVCTSIAYEVSACR